MLAAVTTLSIAELGAMAGIALKGGCRCLVSASGLRSRGGSTAPDGLALADQVITVGVSIPVRALISASASMAEISSPRAAWGS